MARTISYWPPGRREGASRGGAVRRRHVLYVPGYDHEARSRSRSLFVRELIRYGRRFGLTERAVGKVEDLPDVPAVRWTVRAAKDDWATDTVYDVLRWDDLVEADFRKSVALRILARLIGAVDALVTSLAYRLYRLNWVFAAVGTYPLAMILLLGLGAALVGTLAAWLVALLGAPRPVSWLLGLVATVGLVLFARPHFGRWYVWHLLYDWLFNWEHGNGRRPDYVARVDRFAAHLIHVARTTEADEVLIVGHSSGAGMAVETAARALEKMPELGRSGPEIAVLTLGTSLPAAALNSRARAIHANLARVMTAPDLLWVEYQAPQDWLNAAGFNPVRALPLGLAEKACCNPVIRSPRFAEITSEQTYRTMLKSPFRMHFQFMMANDKPGEFDFIMIVLGPMRLSERIANPDRAAALAGKPRSVTDAAADAVGSQV